MYRTKYDKIKTVSGKHDNRKNYIGKKDSNKNYGKNNNRKNR